jgi:hypothetical protein
VGAFTVMPSLLGVAVQACASGGAEGSLGAIAKGEHDTWTPAQAAARHRDRFDKRAANHHAAVYRGAAVVVTNERIG